MSPELLARYCSTVCRQARHSSKWVTICHSSASPSRSARNSSTVSIEGQRPALVADWLLIEKNALSEEKNSLDDFGYQTRLYLSNDARAKQA